MIPTDANATTSGRSIPVEPAALRGRVPILRLPGRNISKADVLVYQLDGRRVAIKDYGVRGFVVRNTLGRILVARECRAYEAAEGTSGLVRFLGRVGPHALATEWIDASTLASRAGERLDHRVFDRLDAILSDLHARGVALGDLHHRDVLLTERGDVFLVDLTAAVVRKRALPFLGDALFARAAAQDRLAAARMRARFTGRDEAEALADHDPQAVRRWRTGRRVKGAWDRLRGKGR